VLCCLAMPSPLVSVQTASLCEALSAGASRRVSRPSFANERLLAIVHRLCVFPKVADAYEMFWTFGTLHTQARVLRSNMVVEFLAPGVTMTSLGAVLFPTIESLLILLWLSRSGRL
jgi:hypothetical protein